MVVQSLDDIIIQLKKNKKMFLAKFGVNKIGVFGSYTQMQQSAESDIDIVIEMEKDKKNIHNFMSFRRFLEKALGAKVDLGFESALKPVVRQSLKGKIIYV